MTTSSSAPWTLIAPGVWKLRLGEPETITPAGLHEGAPKLDAMSNLPLVDTPPIESAALSASVRARGTRIEIPIADATHLEQFYGGGLQLNSMNQTGRKRTLRVNSDPVGDAGDSHAPVPFYLSTAGYGLYVDSARYVTFYLGGSKKLAGDAAHHAATSTTIAASTDELYAARQTTGRTLVIDIPAAQGVDLYLFAGPTPLNVVQRYNLYSGGGCLPPMWGLGVWYRMFGKATGDDAVAMAQTLRKAQLPCDVLGLEPGWQSQAYSCSFVWSPERFPAPSDALDRMRALGYHINLWEHAFTHPTSPLYAPLKPHSGDYEVWSGLVPDFAIPEARTIFGDYHGTQLVDLGVSGFKLDECDHSDFIRGSSWSFPEASQFPSGMDGEQMHSMIGLLYQRTINDTFEARDQRTYSEVRSSGAFAAALPFVLYSDLYDHRDFIRGVATSSFCGMLWCPEVRDAKSREELLRRIQAVVLSPKAAINAWYIKNPPWLQFDRAKNNADDLLPEGPEIEAQVRKLFRLRMSLIPYLYAAFAKYHDQGVPPFRAVVLDYPSDTETHKLDDAYMMGDDLLVAPVFTGQTERNVYLPAGDWYDLHTRQPYAGGQLHRCAVEQDTVLVFARSGAMIPLAEPVQFIDDTTVFDLTIHTFGPVDQLRPLVLHEDDGVSFAYRHGAFNRVIIRPDRSVTREGNFDRARYRIVAWQPT